VDIAQQRISGVWLFTPRQHVDDRGVFLEWYQAETTAGALGARLHVAQANHSVSRRGTLRGVHYADVPPGQAKYVYCTHGAVLDIAVDLRLGSPTYGSAEAVRLDDVDRRAVYLAEGLGHAFLALTGTASVSYLSSTAYNPQREHAVHPLDPALNLPWPAEVELLLSAKDAAAPTLAEAAAAGALPSYESCRQTYHRAADAERRRSTGQ
jgi:dTDP-4-dehydrorhamnose 3,5-epimerase